MHFYRFLCIQVPRLIWLLVILGLLALFPQGVLASPPKAPGNLRLQVSAPPPTPTPTPTPGLNVPTNHQRIWWTPARIQTAKTWWAKHSFVPDPSDPWGNAFAYVVTGNTQYGNTAVNLLMTFTISQSELDGVASDNYRWNDWVPVVYDWCYDLMTPTQVSTFMARYNNYTTIMIGKSWGGPGMEGNNYYWGILRNELNWAIATYYENPQAQTYLTMRS